MFRAASSAFGEDWKDAWPGIPKASGCCVIPGALVRQEMPCYALRFASWRGEHNRRCHGSRATVARR